MGLRPVPSERQGHAKRRPSHAREQQFIKESFDRAGEILYAPERDDWYLVTNALLERGALSGDEVRDLLPA